ncbi:hypothetical protein EDC01DRAFT_783054 [Geopyxis carbonaria]|nr:hypothetical protein EDC01DRAFT_783054 [Geopyxis carbonaria]
MPCSPDECPRYIPCTPSSAHPMTAHYRRSQPGPYNSRRHVPRRRRDRTSPPLAVPPTPFPLLRLPPELLLAVADFVPTLSLANATETCRALYAALAPALYARLLRACRPLPLLAPANSALYTHDHALGPADDAPCAACCWECVERCACRHPGTAARAVAVVLRGECFDAPMVAGLVVSLGIVGWEWLLLAVLGMRRRPDAGVVEALVAGRAREDVRAVLETSARGLSGVWSGGSVKGECRKKAVEAIMDGGVGVWGEKAVVEKREERPRRAKAETGVRGSRTRKGRRTADSAPERKNCEMRKQYSSWTCKRGGKS